MEETLLITENLNSLLLTLHRPEKRNSLNESLIKTLHQTLDVAEANANCRFIVLQGENDFFCTGMDLEEATQPQSFSSEEFMRLLKRFTTTSKIIISLIDGLVLAGGVGLAAASDLVISTSKTQFGLSEALWGLLPACVLPFLIRRVGFQKAYTMTLTAQNINAEEAKNIGLIDELSENLTERLRLIQLRLNRIHEQTVFDLKAYFRKLWIISEEMEKIAVSEINRLVVEPRVQNNIRNFVEHQQFPWEKK